MRTFRRYVTLSKNEKLVKLLNETKTIFEEEVKEYGELTSYSLEFYVYDDDPDY